MAACLHQGEVLSKLTRTKAGGRESFLQGKEPRREWGEDECCCWELGAFSHSFGVSGQQKGDSDSL